MKSIVIAGMAAVLLSGCASTTKPGEVGASRTQLLTIPAAEVDAMALSHFNQQNRQASAAGRLLVSGPEYARVQRIARRLHPHVATFRPDAVNWEWELALIDAPVLNATCAPGGKITFYTGIIRKLQLSDDEIAVIMGHEIAHALREHGREKMSQAHAQNTVVNVAANLFQKHAGKIAIADRAADYLIALPNSRLFETEADHMGLELSARAGYDPKAAVSVWQKMGANREGAAPAEFVSTHPSDSTRIADITAMLPKVTPLYVAAAKP